MADFSNELALQRMDSLHKLTMLKKIGLSHTLGSRSECVNNRTGTLTINTSKGDWITSNNKKCQDVYAGEHEGEHEDFNYPNSPQYDAFCLNLTPPNVGIDINIDLDHDEGDSNINNNNVNNEFVGYQEMEEKYDMDGCFGIRPYIEFDVLNDEDDILLEKDPMSYYLDIYCKNTNNNKGTWQCYKCMFNNNSILADTRCKNIKCDGSGINPYHYFIKNSHYPVTNKPFGLVEGKMDINTICNNFGNDEETAQFCLNLKDNKFLTFCCKNTTKFDLESIVGEFSLFETFGDKSHLFESNQIEFGDSMETNIIIDNRKKHSNYINGYHDVKIYTHS